MERIEITARPNWEETVQNEGLLWAMTEDGPYWNEALEKPVYYKLSEKEAAMLEEAANDVQAACISSLTWLFEEASDADRTKWFDLFGIPHPYRDYIIKSWNDDEWGMYGRFDFIMTKGGPRLLEYNADTPTTLIESALSQWNWFADNKERGIFTDKHCQFNEIHESLVRHWRDMKEANGVTGKVHFASFSQIDDLSTVAYMAEVAKEAGIDVDMLPMEEIGWNGQEFTDPEEKKIDTCFKLYPWEWMIEDEFGQHVPTTDTRWIEAPWKMILSNKAMLALLWERHSQIGWLVPAYLDSDDIELVPGDKWVSKPLLSREGCNVTFYEVQADGSVEKTLETEGNYDVSDVVIQKYIEWEPVDGKYYPMLGVWMVGDDAVGMGIREDDGPVTQNNSRFIPHVFEIEQKEE